MREEAKATGDVELENYGNYLHGIDELLFRLQSLFTLELEADSCCFVQSIEFARNYSEIGGEVVPISTARSSKPNSPKMQMYRIGIPREGRSKRAKRSKS